MSKLIKIYYINDGIDGVVCAKNLKQVACLLSQSWAYGGKGGYTKQQLLKHLKIGEKSLSVVFCVSQIKIVRKKSKHSKSKIIGWIEY